MSVMISNNDRAETRAASLSGSIARDVAVTILSGDVKPGQLLEGEVDACLRLRVSRTAYREAMRILVAKGLVESRRRAGTKVTSAELWHWLDPDVVGWLLGVQRGRQVLPSIYELRRAIEPSAAALAAERRTEPQQQAMRAALVDIYRLPAGAARMSQREFRAVMFESAGNCFFSAMGRIIDQALAGATGQRAPRPTHSRAIAAKYSELFAAISATDVTAARTAMSEVIDLEI
ncbi:FadR family transcriptional regulator [Steroidobacter sp. S1-65]|uniref:FadR family transcriptional regulator n=1 Tax=Steroidobacter gossypii TaxID=2805490 RepID=A0ABS1X086_9GAMM|nr:FCD domain-containing protein [Steroidobacter gossypii]MBM0106631.1 FadR family transcriptional regulator [Steroidobacter gossypii]